MKLQIFLTFFIVLCFDLNWCEAETNDLQNYYNNLNDAEKVYFSKYFLTKGCLQDNTGRIILSMNLSINFPDDIVRKFESLKAPKNFPVNFVHKVMAKYHISKPEVMRLARDEQVCIEGIGCIDPGDVGNICCTYD